MWYADLDPTTRRSRYPGWGLDGSVLHDRVTGLPPATWSITKADLRFLRHEVQNAVAERYIMPTAMDKFHNHMARGPNMYSVVRHYVKPLTYSAGRMSWALLRHPQGLRCTLFITHCWSEGAFEFINKVLFSWPLGLRQGAAWCCIFANPQNLDISDLIREPRSSPFALALRTATHMMVVPTKVCSIYTRIWCVFEAFLATEEGKTIFVARGRVGSKPMLCSLLAFCLIVPLNVLAAHLWLQRFGGREQPFNYEVCQWSNVIAGAFTVMVSRKSPIWGSLASILGASTATWFAVAFLDRVLELEGDVTKDTTWNRDQIFWMAMCVFWPLNEMDRRREEKACRESGELSQGYLGSTRAYSSNEDDKRRILADLGDRTGDVDFSIQVLIDAQMSTPCLRASAAAGVSVRQGAHVRSAFTMVAAFGWMAISDEMQMPVPATISIGLSFMLLFWLSENDHRTFMSVATLKLMLVAILARWVVGICSGFGFSQLPVKASRPVYLPLIVLAAVCCLFGRLHLIGIPCCGAWLVDVLGPGCSCRKRHRPHLLVAPKDEERLVQMAEAHNRATRIALQLESGTNFTHAPSCTSDSSFMAEAIDMQLDASDFADEEGCFQDQPSVGPLRSSAVSSSTATHDAGAHVCFLPTISSGSPHDRAPLVGLARSVSCSSQEHVGRPHADTARGPLALPTQALELAELIRVREKRLHGTTS